MRIPARLHRPNLPLGLALVLAAGCAGVPIVQGPGPAGNGTSPAPSPRPTTNPTTNPGANPQVTPGPSTTAATGDEVNVSFQVSPIALGARALLLEAVSGDARLVDIQSGVLSTRIRKGQLAVALLDPNMEPSTLLVKGDDTLFQLDSDTSLGTLTFNTQTGDLTTVAPLRAVAAASLPSWNIQHGAAPDLTDLRGLKAVASPKSVDLSKLAIDGLADADGDKVPDFLDNDCDENGAYDREEGVDLTSIIPLSTPSADIRAELGTLRPYAFDNLKLDATQVFRGDGDFWPHSSRHVLAFHLDASPALLSLIDKVEIPAPPAYARWKIAPLAGGYRAISAYPPAGQQWSNTSFRLPLLEGPGGKEVHGIWIESNGDPSPAFLQYKITFRDGSTALANTRIHYVFHTPSRVDSVAGTTISYPVNAGDPGTSTNPITIPSTGTTVTLEGRRPLTRAGGSPIVGMKVNAHIFYLDASGNQIRTIATQTPQVTDLGPIGTPLQLVLDKARDLPTTVDGRPVASYKVDFTVSGRNGDNCAEWFYLKY